MAYGYRVSEITEFLRPPPITECKQDSQLTKLGLLEDEHKRVPVMVSLGPHLKGSCLPHPDPKDLDTAARGVQRRMLYRPPSPSVGVHAEVKAFTRSWCEKMLTPLSPETDTSFEIWIESTNYPRHRKNELLDVYYAMLGAIQRKDYKCNSHIKWETYVQYKHARNINARVDAFKVFSGPIFKLIEQSLFKLKYFVKKIPVKDRPKFIMERLFRAGSKYGCTDYSCFESLFTKEFMNSCEMVLYEYMVQHLPDGPVWFRIVKDALTGKNICRFRGFIAEVMGTRMSGDMCTSLGNGFANLMIMLFLADKLGLEIDGVVEGDDGLFVSKNGVFPAVEDFESLGMKIKIDVVDTISEASFCGLVFDPDDLINVTDPIAELSGFGWGTGRYASARRSKLNILLRCKGLSLAHQYAGCPILQSLARYSLRITRGTYVDHYIKESGLLSTWERDQLLQALRDEKSVVYKEPPINTRLLVERLYGVTIEVQKHIEDLIDSKDDLLPIDSPLALDLCWPEWLDYSERFTMPRRVTENGMSVNCAWFALPQDRVKFAADKKLEASCWPGAAR